MVSEEEKAVQYKIQNIHIMQTLIEPRIKYETTDKGDFKPLVGSYVTRLVDESEIFSYNHNGRAVIEYDGIFYRDFSTLKIKSNYILQAYLAVVEKQLIDKGIEEFDNVMNRIHFTVPLRNETILKEKLLRNVSEKDLNTKIYTTNFMTVDNVHIETANERLLHLKINHKILKILCFNLQEEKISCSFIDLAEMDDPRTALIGTIGIIIETGYQTLLDVIVSFLSELETNIDGVINSKKNS